MDSHDISKDPPACVLRKVGWRILPFAMLLYLVSFTDILNICFAALTMNKDTGLSATTFWLGAGIFFAGYFLFEVPSNLIQHRVAARIWIARVMTDWCIASGTTAFVYRRLASMCCGSYGRSRSVFYPRHGAYTRVFLQSD